MSKNTFHNKKRSFYSHPMISNQSLIRKAMVHFVCALFFGVAFPSCNGTPTLTYGHKLIEETTLTQITLQTEISKIDTVLPNFTTSATWTPVPRRTKTPTFTPGPPTNTPLPCPPFVVDTKLPEPDIPENYVGRHYDTRNLPDGLVEMGGIEIDEKHEYVLTHLMWKQERIIFWLEKFICNDKNGIPYFEIIDAIASPPVKIDLPPWWAGNERITSWCFQGDDQISDVIAIGLYDKAAPVLNIGTSWGQEYSIVNFAFRIDTNKWKFGEIETKNLRCYEDVGAGYPGP